ncbi:MAG: hypothetical protein Q4G66_08655, partial [bacterium]|nr:hypothetical protein [bacterium]
CQTCGVPRQSRGVTQEKLLLGTNTDIAIQLPKQIIPSSVAVFIQNQKIDNITLIPRLKERITEIAEKRSPKEISVISHQSEIENYLLTFKLSENVQEHSISIKYSVQDIGWEPLIQVEILDKSKATVCLEAKIFNNSIDINNADITLIALPEDKTSSHKEEADRYRNQEEPMEEYRPWEKIKYPSSAYAQYHIGILSIQSGEKKYVISAVSCKETKIEDTIYMWKTKEKVVEKYLYAKNPFDYALCDSNLKTSKDNINIFDYKSAWIEAGKPILLFRQNENEIICNSSIEVVENFEKRNTWNNCRSRSTPLCDVKDALFYNHQYEFNCLNKTDTDLKLEVVFEKKYGQDYKNIYNFRENPTKSPGWWHIWELNLNKDQNKSIKFNIDSDKRTYKEYKKYNKSIEGC